jgi:UDP-glucuronate decarboxylase
VGRPLSVRVRGCPSPWSRPLDSKTIAVTGGAGFLGSHLCARLADAGHAVVCLDDFSTGRLANVSHLFSSGRFLLHEHDVLEPFPRGMPRFDEIYNFACPASPLQSRRDPIRTALICVSGTLHCLERAAADGARLFHASGREVYGAPARHLSDEERLGGVAPLGPRACHEEGKRMAETLVSEYAHRSALDCRIGRIFDTYGPGMRPDDESLLARMIVQALKGQDLTLPGSGDQACSLCFVDDLTEGVLRSMACPGDVSTPIDLGDPHQTTVAALAELVLELTGSSARVVPGRGPADAPRSSPPDISQARRRLGWAPQVPLREGLRRTIDDVARALGLDGDRARRPPAKVIPFGAARVAPFATATP